MSRSRHLLWAFALFAACTRPAPTSSSPRAYAPADVPAALRPLVEKGDAAISQLQKGLVGKLTSAVAEGGPAAAVAVCQVDAPRLAGELAGQNALELGRTSHRLRNPANAPRAWAADIVAGGAGTQATAATPWVLDLGDRVGLLRPIATGPLCLVCHGAKDSLAPVLTATLAARYPQDQAVDFAAGDLRGWFWVELRK